MTNSISSPIEPHRNLFRLAAIGVALVFPVAFGSVGAAQNDSQGQAADAPSKPPAFEVASIRAVSSHPLEDLVRGIGLYSMSAFPANLFTARNATLTILIGTAYGISSDQLSGKPDWLDSQQYDVNAKIEGDTSLTREQMQPLLQQRFGLTIHRENKDAQGYALVVAKGGAKLHPSKEGMQPHGQLVPNGLQFWSCDPGVLASVLAGPAGRPVVDKTGIKGKYDVKLDFAPATDPNSNLPSIFTALQEQLGLKLEPQRVPVTVFVIDHVNRIPTEN